MKKILRLIVFSLVAAGLLAVMGWSFVSGAAADEAVICRRIQVDVKDIKGDSFVVPEDVAAGIKNKFGDLCGKRLCEMDLVGIEEYVNERSAVLKSEVYTTRDSVLHVNINQREPVLRFQRSGIGCYCDDRGNLFPLQGKTAARVLVVDGNLPVDPTTNGQPGTQKARTWTAKMICLADYISHSSWRNRVSQMKVDAHGDLVICLRGSRERFIFGTPDDIEPKFDRIEAYLTSVKPSLAEGRSYASVNVKFNNQLVCR